MGRGRVLLSWSSGKDSAWALHVLRRQAIDVVGLLTTFNAAFDRVAMRAVRSELVAAQAVATGLPLWSVPLPWPRSNSDYERLMSGVLQRAVAARITHVAFGDLFLQDIRDYRVRELVPTGLEPLFPLWCSSHDTPALARAMLDTLRSTKSHHADISVAGSHFMTTLSNPCFRTFQNQDGSDSPLNV